jgi:hypothetical protein
MIVIFGDDTDKAKARFLNLIESNRTTSDGVEWFMSKELDIPRFRELLTGSDLFGQKKSVYLENLSGNYKGKKRDEIREILKSEDSDNLIILEEKFDSRFYQGLDVKKEEYKLPALIFNYLDSLGQVSTNTLKYYMAVVQLEPAEKVFRMTVLRLQDLMRIKSNPNKYDISKFYWKKIYQQAQKLPFERLANLYLELYTIDKETKSGVSGIDLGTRFELFWQLYRL